eukprot:1331420-Prymnesium_polylepis.1
MEIGGSGGDGGGGSDGGGGENGGVVSFAFSECVRVECRAAWREGDVWDVTVRVVRMELERSATRRRWGCPARLAST